ncbi:MAG TPA: hypothetical protein VGA55_08415 [Bacteroidota bacterium]
MATNLPTKLNIKSGMKLRVLGKPASLALPGVTTTSSGKADGVMVFVKTLADVDKTCGPAMEAAKADKLAWIVYPKAGQLDTDLNRDILWNHVARYGIQGVRQIALDEVWSAMRFRPKK